MQRSQKDHLYIRTTCGIEEQQWLFGRRSNLQTSTYLHFNDMQVHQIRIHNFFQGESSVSRLNPEEVIEFFYLKIGKNYKTRQNTKDYWDCIEIGTLSLWKKYGTIQKRCTKGDNIFYLYSSGAMNACVKDSSVLDTNEVIFGYPVSEIRNGYCRYAKKKRKFYSIIDNPDHPLYT
jgi:hypothetical protein